MALTVMLSRADAPQDRSGPGLPSREAATPDTSEFSREQATAYEAVLDWLRRNTDLADSTISAAMREAEERHEPAPLTLNRMGAVNDASLQSAFCAVSHLPPASSPLRIGARDAREIAPDFLRAHRALVLEDADETLTLGLVDPFDHEAVTGARFATGKPIRVEILRAGEQRRAFDSAYEEADAAWSQALTERDEERLDAASDSDRDAPVARRVSSWLSQAVEHNASDIHIEPRSHALIVRMRVDGVLRTIAEEPLTAAAAVVTRIKVLADMDLGERRAAQDGRATIVVAGRPIELRASVVPSVNGESAVIRILDRAGVRLDIGELGFDPVEQHLLRRVVGWPHGLFVVTGPTGSGKTTTLYACLEAMRDSERKILAIEDPVEFQFDHVTQVQSAPKAGVTFPSSIRAFLRQDPDVIMVGEIRDSETAMAAVQAALTGHLVLATLHAIDSARVVPRLKDMGVDGYQLAACFRGALAQRLVRRLCPDCRAERPATPAECDALGLGLEAGETVFASRGCETCAGQGYLGRIAVAEGYAAGPAHAALIQEGKDSGIRPDGRTLTEDGVNKLRAGLTAPDELVRALKG